MSLLTSIVHGLNETAATVGSDAIWLDASHQKTSTLDVPPDVFDLDITQVHLHACRTGMSSHGPDGSDLRIYVAHFRIFLVIKGSRRFDSVSLNSMGYTGGATKLAVVAHPYAVSQTNNTLGTLSFQPIRPFTVRSALNLIFSLNRDHYRLNPVDLSGCRVWTQTVLNDFIERSWLPRSAADACQALSSQIREKADTNINPNLYGDLQMPEPPSEGIWVSPSE